MTELNAGSGTAQMYLAGDIDLASAAVIVDHVVAALRHRPRSLILDLSAAHQEVPLAEDGVSGFTTSLTGESGHR